MKVEFLAGLLGKPVTELATTLSVAETADLTENQYGKLLKDHLKESVAAAEEAARLESDGKHTRLVKTALEKEMKSKFPFLKATKIDAMIEELEGEFSKRKPDDDPDRKAQIEAYKLKAQQAEQALAEIEKKAQEREQNSLIAKKLEKHLSKFDFASEKVKQLAISTFIGANKFIVSGEDLFLEKDGKPVVNFEKDVDAFLSDFGKPVERKPNVPPTPPGDKGGGSDTSRSGLFKSLRTTTDPVERARIQEQINSLPD
jgi:hypothetical protein